MRGWQFLLCAIVGGCPFSVLGDPPAYDHVVVVIEENHSLSQVMGSPSAPYINNTLAANGSSLTNMFAITHPSQPNYLQFFSGSSQGVTTDNVPATFPFAAGTSNLGGALLNAGKTFTGYSESMPSAGYNGATFTTASGDYARKHNPWVNWQSASPSGFQLPIATNQPFTSFPSDYSTLANVSVVVPNLTDDMHDGTIAQGDTWLQNNIGPYATWAQTHNSLLIVTWDEDDSSSSRNRIPTILYGANVVTGQNNSTWTLQNLLRTVEDTYGTTHSGTAANVKPIVGSFTSDWIPVIRSYQQNVNGYTSAQDTYIDSTSGQTNVSHATATDILVDGSPNQQALIKFDNIVGNGASQVATGTKIWSAKLRIYTSTATNAQTPNDVGLLTLQRSWSDADTYDSLVGGISGSEVASAPSFTLTPNKQGVYVVFDVTDTVQSWVDGTASNYGWMLKDITGTDGWRFLSSDAASAADRPYLEITVPEPGIGLAAMLGMRVLARRPRREWAA